MIFYLDGFKKAREHTHTEAVAGVKDGYKRSLRSRLKYGSLKV